MESQVEFPTTENVSYPHKVIRGTFKSIKFPFSFAGNGFGFVVIAKTMLVAHSITNTKNYAHS